MQTILTHAVRTDGALNAGCLDTGIFYPSPDRSGSEETTSDEDFKMLVLGDLGGELRK